MSRHRLDFPLGEYDVWADDDDVVGLTVARTYPPGYSLVRTDPPIMDAFDEIEVAQFLAWCLSNAATLQALRSELTPPNEPRP